MSETPPGEPPLGESRGERAKRFGAYYTDERVAAFLTAWVIRAEHERVLDPSFGGGVFLEAALTRLLRLGGNQAQVFGVELDEAVYKRVGHELEVLHGLGLSQLLHSDFFAVRPGDLPPLEAVVGNPPFIRYQSFGGQGSGGLRQQALERAREQGVALTRLASSWAPFVVHSCALLGPGGRLGMVLPLELGHAAYARPVLNYLVGAFERVTLITFKERLFPELSQDTLLLLAEIKRLENGVFDNSVSKDDVSENGAASGDLRLLDLTSALDLEPALNETALNPQALVAAAEPIDPGALVAGRTTLAFHWLPSEARALYERLARSPRTRRLGELADLGIGYVSGANAFFHLNEHSPIPLEYLKPAVYRARALRGLRFARADWAEAAGRGDAGHLLALEPTEGLDALPRAVLDYLEHGEREGVLAAYKCRVRSPWYAVPHGRAPSAFLTYMSGQRAQLVANEAGAIPSNTLHAVHLRPELDLKGSDLALAWQSSLSALSAELEGHALGGGMLKLEPSEARRVLLVPPPAGADWTERAERVDLLLREGRAAEAAALADDLILGEVLGLEPAEQQTLREAAELLRTRRYYRGRRPLRLPAVPSSDAPDKLRSLHPARTTRRVHPNGA